MRFTNAKSPLPPPSDIVWIQTGFIGDVVLTSAAIALARRQFPECRQHLITTALGEQVMLACSELDSITVFQKRDAGSLANWWRVARSVRAKISSPATAVTLQVHRSFRSTVLAHFLRLPVVTYRESAGSFWSSAFVDRVSVLHEAARIALPLEALGVDRFAIVQARPALGAAPDALAHSDLREEFLCSGGRRIGIAAGSVWGTKRWPVKAFAELIELLLADPKNSVALLGSKDEESIAAAIVALVGKRERLWNFAGQTTLAQLNQTIAKLDLLVSNDSSPVHFASAHNVPTVAIFGATIPQMGFGPLADRSAVAGIAVDCRPCSDHGPDKCPLGHFRCMLALRPSAVVDLCRAIFEKSV